MANNSFEQLSFDEISLMGSAATAGGSRNPFPGSWLTCGFLAYICRMQVLVEIGSLALVIIAHFACGLYLAGVKPQSHTFAAYITLAASISPTLVSYFLTRIFLGPTVAATSIASILLVLSLANEMKLSLTAEPLSWNDLTASNNWSVISKYFNNTHFVVISVAILSICATAHLSRRRSGRSIHRMTTLDLMAPILFAPIGLYPYGHFLPEVVAKPLKSITKAAGIGYIPFDWGRNIQVNGLPMHLVQTSARQIPSHATTSEIAEFKRLTGSSSSPITRPQQVIFVLCEACWHDSHNYADVFAPLEEQGFQSFRAVSPAYGGGTVNAAFELLSGLPANNQLTGMIYQEYAELFRADADTLPQYLRKQGYTTVELHNYTRTFWRRHIVSPKFGFDRFIALDEMPVPDQKTYFPSDDILFPTALQQLEQYKNTSVFLLLTTVHGHGPYTPQGDDGEGEFESHLRPTIADFTKFSSEVIKLYPGALIVMVADHKPALNKFLYKRGVFSRNDFSSIGERNEDFIFSEDSSLELRGDVPGYIFHESMNTAEFVSSANNQPFFCLAQKLDSYFLSSGLPTFKYAESICDRSKRDSYKAMRQAFPGWLYSLAMLESLPRDEPLVSH